MTAHTNVQIFAASHRQFRKNQMILSKISEGILEGIQRGNPRQISEEITARMYREIPEKTLAIKQRNLMTNISENISGRIPC